MKSKLMIILLGSMLTLAACGGGEEETAQNETNGGTTGGTEATAAEGIYKKSCASCHGGNLEGNIGPSLKKVGSKYSEEEILDIIHNGLGTGMPPGVIQGEDADAVAAWLAGMK
jgi:cytochrome c551